MKKVMFFPSIILIVFISLTACNKNDTNTSESPFFNYFNESAIKIDTVPTATSVWDYGFKFSPLKTGKISSLWLKVPSTGSFVVRLWDVAKDSILAEKSINSSTANGEFNAAITPVSVTQNSSLAVIITAASFYKISKKDATDFEFPKTIGNIQVTSFNEGKPATGAPPAVPPTPNKTKVAPCVNITFVAD